MASDPKTEHAKQVEAEPMVTACFQDGATDLEMAKLLELHPRTVRAIRLRLGFFRRPTPAAEVDREVLHELWACGYGAQVIASSVGCTHRTAQQLLHQEGLVHRDLRPRERPCHQSK